jgi:hypothetical protein
MIDTKTLTFERKTLMLKNTNQVFLTSLIQRFVFFKV